MLFTRDNFPENPVPSVQAYATNIKQKFDRRRNGYHNYWPFVIPEPELTEFNNRLNTFEAAFQVWHPQWNPTFQANSRDQFIQHFETAAQFFEPLEEIIAQVQVKNGLQSTEFKALYEDLLAKFEKRTADLHEYWSKLVDDGIKELLNLKGELSLGKNFKENISTQLRNSTIGSWTFFSSLILTLLAYAGLAIYSFFNEDLKKLEFWQLMILRVSVTISFIGIAYFFLHQFRFYRISKIKYELLYNFLGGGITELNRFLGTDEADKKALYKAIVQKFIDVDDLMKAADAKASPISLTGADIAKIIKELRLIRGKNNEND